MQFLLISMIAKLFLLFLIQRGIFMLGYLDEECRSIFRRWPVLNYLSLYEVHQLGQRHVDRALSRSVLGPAAHQGTRNTHEAIWCVWI